MENERSNYEIDGLGTIRATNGTALDTVAGAAHYWQAQAKSKQSKAWREGFVTGAATVATLVVLFATVWGMFH